MTGGSENSTVLITGASSFTGRFVIDKFLKQSKATLILTSRKPALLKDFSHERVRIETGDLLHPESFERLFQNYPITHVIHLAAMARLRDGELNPVENIKVNFFGTAHLVKLAAKYNVSAFLFTSSDLAREATSVVGMCKYLNEELFRGPVFSSTRFVAVRMPNVIDSPGAVTLLFKKQISQGGPVTITHERMNRRFISGEQAAGIICYAAATGNHGELFVNLDKSKNILRLAQQMIEESGKQIEIKTIGPQPGERLDEKGYQTDEVIMTESAGWGILKINPQNAAEVTRITQSWRSLLSERDMAQFASIKKDNNLC
jgi:FlaA1/EpsC-like NDP-sugar epimerase